MHVTPHLLKPGVIFNDHGSKPTLKQMPAPLMPPVEPDAVTDVQPLPRPAQVRFWRFQQQMKMVRHEHIRVEERAKALRQLCQQSQKVLTIRIVAEDLASLVAPGG
jgi:hypothetical protein